MNGAALTVIPIGWTTVDLAAMDAASGFLWQPDGGQPGEQLAEFAGRACYQSWTKPNPATATNAGYLRHILDVGHLSVLEHGTVTFYLAGVSRSFTHELVRHRHFSYSQLSQRFVPSRGAQMIVPDVIAGDPCLLDVFTEATERARSAYAEIVHALERTLGAGTTAAKKAARQAARAVLPNATETRIVVTGNYRAWRHFIDLRATEHADVEIREVAVAVLRHLLLLAPNVFGDYEITNLEDGSEVASSSLKEGTT